MDLTPRQSEAVAEINNNLQIIACAGSGKTEVITRRIAHILNEKKDVMPENIVAFTFTEKAAESMKNRISNALEGQDIDNLYVGTIHSFCYKLLNEFTERYRNVKVLDSVKNHLFIQRFHRECGFDDLGLKTTSWDIRLFLSCIDKMIDDYDNRSEWDSKHIEIFDTYKSKIYEEGYIDFSFLIFETINQIKTNIEIQEYLKTIKYLVVDEYQDIDDLQEKLINIISMYGANVCVVGDDDQTIYQFRGSNADNMISFSDRYENVHQVKLEQNFRCSEAIVDVADTVISNNENRIVKKMVSGAEFSNTMVSAKRYDCKNDQYIDIRNHIEELHNDGVPYKEMAVLVRKGKYIAPIVSVLTRAGIPVAADSAEEFFKGNYFKRFVNTLNILADIDKSKLYECWNDIVDVKTFNVGFKYLRSCARGGQRISFHTIIEEFCNKINFLDSNCEDLEQRITDLNGIYYILDDYDEIFGDWQLSARVSGLVSFIENKASEEYKYHSFNDNQADEDAVQVMTVHKSKGLEFNTVFLTELEEGEFPASNMGGKKYWHVLGGRFEENKDKYKSDIEDERKLFYVAVTRAKQNLYMMFELTEKKHNVSQFVIEASESGFIKIDKEDLISPSKPDDMLRGYMSNSSILSSNPYATDIQDNKSEYCARVKDAKNKLYDYYGTACHYCPGAHADLIRIKSMTPEEILSEARKNGLIKY